MMRLLKIFLSIFAVIILLVLIAVVVLPLLVNPNDFKPEIQAAVKNNLDRELTIEGDLQLSVFPWIGISTGKLSLSNAAGFSEQVFAEIAESNIKVKLLPLLSKELEVSRVVLKGLVLNLAKNKQGVSNWDDLTSKETSPAKPSQADEAEQKDVSPLAALAIGGVSIEQARISWDDQQQGKYTEINDFNFSTGKLVFDKAIDIDLSLTVVNKEPELTETVIFSTGLIINKEFKLFKLTDLKLESITKGKAIPGKELKAELLAEVAVDLVQQTLAVTGLKLSSGDLQLSAEINGINIKDNPEFKGPIKIESFNLAQFMQQISMPLPKMQSADALTHVSASFMLDATADSAEIKNLMLKLDDTSINGFSRIKNFAKAEISFDINIDDIDVDRYLAPKKPNESNKAVATPATAAVAGAALFPVETLRALNANGQVTIAKLKINQLSMQGVSLKLNASKGVINTQQQVKQLYKGAYKGRATVNVKNKTPVLSLNENLSKVNIEPLLKDMLGEARMSGVVNASAQIQGRGNTTKAIKSSLGGKLNFNFNDGVIRGFNLQKIIDNTKALIEGSALPTENKNDQTVFSVIKGTANITKGLVRNNDLYAEASKLRVNGVGTANLATDELDYKVKARLLKTVATATEAEKIKGVPIVLNVGGTLAKPSYQLDIAAMLLEKNKDKINKKKDELLKKLDDKVGPGVGDLIRGFL